MLDAMGSGIFRLDDADYIRTHALRPHRARHAVIGYKCPGMRIYTYVILYRYSFILYILYIQFMKHDRKSVFNDKLFFRNTIWCDNVLFYIIIYVICIRVCMSTHAGAYSHDFI